MDEQQNTTEEPEQTEPTENKSEKPTNESTGKEEKSDSSSDTDVDNDVRSSLKAQVMKKNTPMLRGASTFTFDTITISKPAGYTGVGPDQIVIMDRNLGATSNDITSSDSYGYHYQWGNNYGFPSDGSEITTGSEQVDASSYGPSNPYSSDTFIIRSSSPYDWSSVQNDNLRGGANDSESNNRGLDDLEDTATDRQGPCPDGYHVPSAGEWSKVGEYWCLNHPSVCSVSDLREVGDGRYYLNNQTIVDNLREDIKLPFAGYRYYSTAKVRYQGDLGSYWSSSPYSTNNSWSLYVNRGGLFNPTDCTYRSYGQSVRCFKNSLKKSPKTFSLSLSASS